MDSWKDLREPCPSCGGVVEKWYFGPDCRGNASSSGIDCKKCARSFSSEQWERYVMRLQAEISMSSRL